MRLLVTDDSRMSKEIVDKLKENEIMVDPVSSGVIPESVKLFKKLSEKQVCQEYFRQMSLKGFARNRKNKINRLRMSILTKKRHK